MAQCIADGRAPEIIEAFGLGRFGAGELVGEKGAAAVGH
jgi:sarcosine oxidase subunit beta